MNLEYARYRINDVAKPDSITTSTSDFFATHVPMNRLQLLDTFQVNPSQSKYYSEEMIFENYVQNPNNLHQLLIVYGQSGTGKSHLIRWFNAKLENIKSENEIILFIKRSDNTLKGTIKQLLSKDEIKNIPNKDIFERLVKASAEMPEKELKSTIYLSFITLIEADDGKKYDSEKSLGNVKRRRIAEYLRSSKTQEMLSREDGPIERIYSKVAAHTFVDRDVIAEFKASDFLDEEFNLEMQNSDEMTKNAQRVLMEFNSEEGYEIAKKYADYLNQLIPDVIQRCSGIQPGDFGEVFKEIRKELWRKNKQLTVFIEDITSFTGVDVTLLDALTTEHTGENNQLCRLNSIIGGTSTYIDSKFKQNHKDRTTKFIYVPSEIFDSKRLYEFFGKYLNTMSMPIDVFDHWVANGAKDDQYPIHQLAEGKGWDYVKLTSGQVISLYPFTKNAIKNFYEKKLDKDKRIPRYILRMIIEPVVREILDNKEEFPSDQFNFMSFDTELNFAVTNLGYDTIITQRLLRFIAIWGNGKPRKYTQENGDILISEIPTSFFTEFKLPCPSFGTAKLLPKSEPIEEENEIEDINKEIPKKTSVIGNKMRDVSDQLSRWVQGEEIDISTTAGTLGIISNARKALSEYLETAINWEAEGVPYDLIQKIKKSSVFMVTLSNTKRKSPGLFLLPSNNESAMVLSSFSQKVLNKNGWNYAGASIDAYAITSWTEKHKKEIIQAIMYYNKETKTPYKYIEAAICSEVFRAVLNGEYHDKTFRNLNAVMYKDADAKKLKNGHVKEWNSLIEYLSQQNRDKNNKDTIKQYFNIRMGTDTALSFVVDTVKLDSILKKLRNCKFEIKEEEQQIDDPVKGRKAIYEYYNELLYRIKKVAEKEKKQGSEKLEVIENTFEDDEITSEDINHLCHRIEEMKKLLNEIQISFPQVKTDVVKKTSSRIADAIKTIQSVMLEENYLNLLIAFSGDPMGTIDPLLVMIDDLSKMVYNIESKIKERECKLENDNYDMVDNDYSDQLIILDEAISNLGGLDEWSL